MKLAIVILVVVVLLVLWLAGTYNGLEQEAWADLAVAPFDQQ